MLFHRLICEYDKTAKGIVSVNCCCGLIWAISMHLRKEQRGRRKMIMKKAETLQIKYHSREIEKLRYIDGKSDWIDLRAAEDVALKAGEYRLISFGISIKIPEGYEAHVVPRSSTFKNFGILQSNSCGIIDCSYCGENDIWKMPVYAVRDTEIHVNDRICQFRIMKNQPRLVFDEVAHLDHADRGGHGSTGKQ